MKRLGTRRLTTPVDPWVQQEREAQFARNMDAFIRRDFSVIDETMRPDVTLELPGSSWLAGTYRGLEAVSRGVIALRQVFNSDKRLVTSGPRHEVEMNLGVRIGYDEQGKSRPSMSSQPISISSTTS